jgi:hypothetical protein
MSSSKKQSVEALLSGLLAGTKSTTAAKRLEAFEEKGVATLLI